MNQNQWLKMTDVERWKWVQAHQGEGFVVILDNDQTFMYDQNCPEGTESEHNYDFNDYIGWADGVVTLMEVMGIECEMV